jgi:O-antigen/teichoic acid export membrane protein
VENILLNFVLIPTWSLNGAALGTSISQALVACALVYFSLRTVGSVGWSRVFAGPIIASGASGAVIGLLRHEFAVAVVAGALVYLVVLLVFERVTFPDDARVLLQLRRGGLGRLAR